MVWQPVSGPISAEDLKQRSHQRFILAHWLENGSLPKPLDKKLRENERLRLRALFSAFDQLSVYPSGPERAGLEEFLRVYDMPLTPAQKVYREHAFGNAGAFKRKLAWSRLRTRNAEAREYLDWMAFMQARESMPPLADPGPDAEMPKVFQFWDKNTPPDVERLMDEWRALVGPENHKLYNAEEGREIVGEHCGSDALKIWDTIWTPAIAADLFRLVALHRWGGCYVDADLIPTTHARAVMHGIRNGNWIIWRTDLPDLQVTNMFIKGEAGDPTLGRCVEHALHNLKTRLNDSPLMTTGPYMITRTMVEVGDPNGDWHTLPRHYVAHNLTYDAQPSYKGSSLHWKKALAERPSS